jgi:hypothetical protein
MRWAVAAALALFAAGCGHKAEEPPANQASATEKASTNVGSNAAATAAGANIAEALPPSGAALRFVGRWAKDRAGCKSAAWVFTKDALTATGGPHCSIYNVKTVPGGYDLAAECPAKKPDPTDLIKLRFAESARAMLVESNAIEPMGLIYCGK